LQAGELVMIGIAPKVSDMPAWGATRCRRTACIPASADLHEPSDGGVPPDQSAVGSRKERAEIDAPARAYFAKEGFSKYLVCPFVHTIGLHEAEAPFFGPKSGDVLRPGMTVCVDVSFFGHPEFNGARIETGYEITDKGPVPMSERMDRICTAQFDE
jgi:hypothetical protein